MKGGSDPHELTTFCRICEPMCGLVARVADGRVVSVRADKDHRFSQGFACIKAAAMIDVTEDPDRVVTPLRRVGGPGEFETVSWDLALDDIAQRLRRIVAERGPDSYATFFGNPPAFNASALIAIDGFQKTIGSRWKYGVNGEDAASWVVANAILFGSPALMPRPDLWRCQFLLMLGANPLVSHGSTISEPQVRKALDGIVDRGGRVVVVDPRHTETARRYEHVAVRPGTDAWLLLGILHVLVKRHLVDADCVARHTTGYDVLAETVAQFPVERCATRCGVPADTIEELARSLAAAAPAASVYGRTGTCTQRFGTLNNLLQGLLNVVTGNVERPGGTVFGWAPIDFARSRLSGLDTYGKVRTRVLGLPDALGMLPSQGLVPDITTPGPGRIRALMTFGANPVLSSGAGGPRLEEALESLDLHFSLDLYVNETNKHAHYVLPATTAFERDDVPLLAMPLMLRPSLYATRALVPPRGEAREEWQVLNELAQRMGRGGAYTAGPLRWLARAGVEVPPLRLADVLIRTSQVGDWFGLRRKGLSLRKLLDDHPHGVTLRETLPVRPLAKRLRTPDRRVPLAAPPFLDEVRRLAAEDDGADKFPLRVIGMREVRSHNSWMHNVERLMPDSRRAAALVHPVDADHAGLADDDPAAIISASGRIVLPIRCTEDVAPGTVAIPHSWGHHGGWRRANAAGGACSNLLASADPDDIEPLAGMSILNGIPVRIEPVASKATPEAQTTLRVQLDA